MSATPAEIRLAFEDFLNDLDGRQVDFDWTLANAKAAFELWLCQGKPLPFAWNDLFEHEVKQAMSRRYRGFTGHRWAR